MTGHQPPPKFLDLLRIRMPVGAVASFGHRFAGVVLFLVVPLGIYLLDLSVQGPDGYARAAALWHSVPVQLLSIAVVWSLAHHLFAGLRFLLIDLNVGVDRRRAHRSAWAVNLAAVVVVLGYLGALL
ncbi:MAG: succinate dehydrogenase, cytochrome b556 subunit [Gammaproteobacteria bacterium]